MELGGKSWRVLELARTDWNGLDRSRSDLVRASILHT